MSLYSYLLAKCRIQTFHMRRTDGSLKPYQKNVCLVQAGGMNIEIEKYDIKGDPIMCTIKNSEFEASFSIYPSGIDARIFTGEVPFKLTRADPEDLMEFIEKHSNAHQEAA